MLDHLDVRDMGNWQKKKKKLWMRMEGGGRKTDTFLFFLLFVQFNLSYIEKIYFWWQSTGP